jgi:hypothetical protein
MGPAAVPTGGPLLGGCEHSGRYQHTERARQRQGYAKSKTMTLCAASVARRMASLHQEGGGAVPLAVRPYNTRVDGREALEETSLGRVPEALLLERAEGCGAPRGLQRSGEAREATSITWLFRRNRQIMAAP